MGFSATRAVSGDPWKVDSRDDSCSLATYGFSAITDRLLGRAANYPSLFKAHGLYFSRAIIWDKQHPVLTRKDYMGSHEWGFYGRPQISVSPTSNK
jgi:hypothetical protein